MSNSYSVPATFFQVEIDVKKSRFIARADQVSSRGEAMLFVEQAKVDYPDARHYCWAYLIGNPQAASCAAMNDAGEPSGTAGKPIFNVIQHKKIGNIMVVVVRYFGGVKLGAGGLTRAYSAATEALLATMPLQMKIATVDVKLVCNFSQEQLIRHWATQWRASVVNIDYQEQVTMYLKVPEINQGEVEKYCLANKIYFQI